MSTSRSPCANQAKGMTVPREALRGLVAAGHRRLRRAVRIEARHLEGRDRQRRRLVGDVVDPGEGRRRRPQLRHILVRHDHDLASALQRLRNRQAGVGRMRKGGARVQRRDHLRPRHVGNVEDEEAVVPVADIEAVAVADRMVAARRHVVVPRDRARPRPATGRESTSARPPRDGPDRRDRGSSRCCRHSLRRSARCRRSGRRNRSGARRARPSSIWR